MSDKVKIELTPHDALMLTAQLTLLKNSVSGVNGTPDIVITAVEKTGVLDNPEAQEYLKLLEHATLDVSLTAAKDNARGAKACLLAMSGLDSDNEDLRQQALADVSRILR
jgi:hypothetical protein